jgi:hypothetical protein
MREEAKLALTAMGALAELCGELKRQLMKNGFTQREAQELVGRYITATVTPRTNKEDN